MSPGSAPADGGAPLLDVGDAFDGKNLLFIGGTGFVGKVLLGMLLERYGDRIGTVWCLLRPPRDGRTAQQRFVSDVVDSPVFEELRRRMVKAGVADFDAFVQDKIVAIGGDLTKDNMGVAPGVLEEIAPQCDVIMNSSGLVDFNPPLHEAIAINVVGVQGVVDFAKTTRGSALIHVSTCYVTGNRDGDIAEDPDILNWCPADDDLMDGTFDFRKEIAGCLRDIQLTEDDADSTHLKSRFIEAARKRLREYDADPDNEQALADEVADRRARWMDGRMVDRGMERAQHWGWPNTYTFTKSLGEQVVADSGLDAWCILRPSVVESSVEFPFPGWNDGINTSAPLIFMSIKGHTKYPTRKGVNLCVIPVDMVASAMIGATAALLERRHEQVYQVGTSDVNPISIDRMVELVGLFKRDYYRRRPRGNPWFNQLAAWIESYPVTNREFRRTSAPAVARLGRYLSERLAGDGPERLSGPGGMMAGLSRNILGISRTSQKTGDIFDLFMPFIHDNIFSFSCANTRSLLTEQITEADRQRLPWKPEELNWRTYWLDVHCMGLEKWVFPRIKEKIKPRPKKVVRYDHLLHLFRSTTKVHADRTAFRYLLEGGGAERRTYDDFRIGAEAVAGRLAAAGVARGDRVAICGKNRPEWAEGYFGVLLAGAVVVPIDRDSGAAELANVCAAAEAKLLLAGEEVASRLNGELPCPRLDMVATAAPEDAPAAPEIADPLEDDLASLIFTSGTTGKPKGVMLTHGNFTFLLQALAKVFSLQEKDGLLSALPLHHTFEFSCGFLLPLSKGAQLIYMEELDADMLARAFAGGRVTCMVGVPALWELLHRKVKNQVRDKGPLAERAFDGLLAANKTLRNRFGVNLGKVVFAPVHQGFGGRVRFLVSGGASLPPDLHSAFHSLGLDLMEGYGLTEASPVLTVTRPGKRPKPGSVGTPLPGVELKVLDPDEAGVGEIVARGGNVMKGYLGDEDATARAIDDDGWLHTGDIGRIDRKERLFIQGRKKEVIVEASGKNVYPDELEELYGEHAEIEELSVVGVSDGRGGERVAAVVVLAGGVDRVAGRARIEEHFRKVGGGVAGWKRVKVLRFWEGELPRTATRKVKRKDVVRTLERMLEAERAAAQRTSTADVVDGAADDDAWLRAAIGAVCDRKGDDVRGGDRLIEDLGFESLMLTELLSALETATGKSIDPQALQECGTVRDVAGLVDASRVVAKDDGRAGRRAGGGRSWQDDDPTSDDLPAPIQELGKSLLNAGQRWLYNGALKSKVHGQGHVPLNRPLLVVSNHSSHLDMGLVKTAMGKAGDNLVSMAAADYFFRPGPRRMYFRNFTNLEPMQRSGSLKDSLMKAVELVRGGKSVLIFPEGTRSRDGKMVRFKRGVGYLALQAGVDVLPLYLKGAHDTLPVGSALPRGRDLSAHVGPVIAVRALHAMTDGLSRHQAYDVATAVIEDAVLALRDGRPASATAAGERALGRPLQAEINGDGGEADTAQGQASGPSDRPAAGPAPLTGLARLFSDLERGFRPGKLDGDVSYYFSLGAEDSGKWSLVVGPERCVVTPGKPDGGKADCVLKTDEATFTRIVKESYVPSFAEFMSGKIKTNAPDLLRTFQKAFGL